MMIEPHKTCRQCQRSKPGSAFGRHAGSKDGRRGTCAQCVRDHMLVYSRDRYASPLGRARQMVNGAKCRAKRDGISFNVCVEQIHMLVLLGRCQKSGIPFDLLPPENGYTNPFAPSLDRIDARLGYEPDNVQVVCNMFNMGKSDHHELDFIAMCVAVADNFRGDPVVIARLGALRDAGF